MANKVTITWTLDELVAYISNLSAYVAQSLSLSGDVAFDVNTLTEDNKETFLNVKMAEAVNALVPHFSRIIDDDAEFEIGESVTIIFTPRIEGGSYSQAELTYVKTLCRKSIASYILADWYSMKGITAMNNYFVAQYAQLGGELNVVLDRFVRPVRKASVSVGRVTYTSKSNINYTHVNNKSDFVLVWGTANGSPLPNAEYDIDFYTDGEVVRSFNSLNTELVKPIEGVKDKVRIIFDFSDGKYFTNGVLKYVMRGDIQDADFPDSIRHFEQSGETTIEIWDGASDSDADMKASYIPSYMKLEFSDLSESDIAVLQAPALEAAEVANEATALANEATASANEAAADALNQGKYAKDQGDYAKNQGSYARNQADNAYTQAAKAQKAANDWTGENGGIGYKSIVDNTISEAEATLDAKVQEVDGYLVGVSQAEVERQSNETEREQAEKNRAQVFAEKIAGVEEATASANSAAARAEEKANEVGEALGNLDETLATKADADGNYPKMSVGFSENILGDGSATEEVINFRPTATKNRNVRDGAARIERLKGSSVVVNQIAVDMADIAAFKYYLYSFDSSINEFAVLQDGETANMALNLNIGQSRPIIGHYYAIFYKGDNLDAAIPFFGFSSYTTGNVGTWNIGQCVRAGYFYLFPLGIAGAAVAGTKFTLDKVIAIDLTQMFGVGNEPMTAEELWQRLPKGVDLNTYEEGRIVDGNYGAIKTTGYNQFNGTYAKVCVGCPYYLGGNYTSLGFTTEKGDTLEAITLPTSTESVGTTPSDRLYTPTQNGYIYAKGENININISWDIEYGYLNGTYQPYKPFERDLSWIHNIKDSEGNLLFEGGMQQAGSIRDEIRFNSTTQKWEAIKRVGVVDIGAQNIGYSIDKLYFYFKVEGIKRVLVYPYVSNANQTNAAGYINRKSTTSDVDMSIVVNYYDATTRDFVYIKDSRYTDAATYKAAMSGVMLNYELETPIVVEITENVNFDFDVSDYGTEELIAYGESAPLVADIVYEPNALAPIKQIPDILHKLDELDAQLDEVNAEIELVEKGESAEDNLFPSVNLFNGEYDKGFWLASGLQPNSGYYVTKPIKIKGGESYKFPSNPSGYGNNFSNYGLYDVSGNFVEVKRATTEGAFEILREESDCLVSVNIGDQLKDIDTFMFAEASQYPETYQPYMKLLKKGLYVPQEAIISSALLGKILAVDGDSICYGAGYRGGYGKIIAERNGMILENLGIGGGTITAETYSASGEAKHWICRSVANLREDADYILVEGGVNDPGNNAPMGSLTYGYNEALDDTTFYGAFESMLKTLITRFAGKKIGYIAVHKMTREFSSIKKNGESNYYHAARECCDKWGVPFLDLNDEVPAFGMFPNDGELGAIRKAYTAPSSSNPNVGDGWHPNEEGYKKYYCDKIEAFMLSL